MEVPAIEACGLEKTYPGGIVALRGLTFSVAAGSIVALLGPNGAGKSTAVKILTTLARPDSGRARVAGLDVIRDAHRVRRRIGWVPQRSGLDREATGRENLRLQGRLYGLSGPKLERRLSELLERFRLVEAADRVVRGYSGGMERRLSIGMGLVHRPNVLFLDEPTTGLDAQSRTEMWEEISRLAEDEAVTVLFTTHYLEEADRVAARLAILERGRIVAEGTPDELKARLRGDILRLELAQEIPAGTLGSVLEALHGVREASVSARVLNVRVEQGPTAAPTILAALQAWGVTVVSVTISRPSLDDVYLSVTGRSFDQFDPGHHDLQEPEKMGPPLPCRSTFHSEEPPR